MDDVGVADDAVKDGAVGGESVFFVELDPGVDEHGFGVHQESVEVEDERA